MGDDSTPNPDKYLQEREDVLLYQGWLWREVRLKEPYQAISDYADIEVQASQDRRTLIEELKSLLGEESREITNAEQIYRESEIERIYREYEHKKRMENIGYCIQALLHAHHDAYLCSGEAKRRTAEGKGPEGEGGVLDACELLENDHWLEGLDDFLKDTINEWRPATEYMTRAITRLYYRAMCEGFRVEESVIKPLTDRILGLINHDGRFRFWGEFVRGEYLEHVGRPKSYWVEQVLGDEL